MSAMHPRLPANRGNPGSPYRANSAAVRTALFWRTAYSALTLSADPQIMACQPILGTMAIASESSP